MNANIINREKNSRVPRGYDRDLCVMLVSIVMWVRKYKTSLRGKLTQPIMAFNCRMRANHLDRPGGVVTQEKIALAEIRSPRPAPRASFVERCD